MGIRGFLGQAGSFTLTVHRALLNSAVLGIGHRIYTTKKIQRLFDSVFACKTL